MDCRVFSALFLPVRLRSLECEFKDDPIISSTGPHYLVLFACR